MKFCENGPNIPNSLIRERDAGRVVFICGAGVSMQSSGLPSFSELASKVMDELLVPESDKIRDTLNYSQIEPKNRYLSIDRIFSQLEQEYDTYDIEYAVSKVLSLSKHADTTCHEIICDLAKTPNGNTRLITTNFDDLFSRATDCNEMIYPELSDIEDEDKFSQLVYLHGKCVGGNLPRDSELVLSSRSFGKAYLVDGKASQFLKSAFSKFTVVFVGYSSDDPPIQYLLEALAQVDSEHYNVYAFQKRGQEQDNDRWLYQKIKPIYFSDFDDLWETLNHWRHYSVDPKSWTDSVLKMADKGPTSLADWQRSQIAYLASSTSGTKAISERDPPLSAQWLFCFDANFRYANPENRNHKLINSDPFKELGLFEDTLPSGQNPNSFRSQSRIKPTDAWDAFDGTGMYPEHSSESKISSENFNIDRDIKLCNKYLSDWIARISDYPETSYWAIFRKSLDQDLKKKISTKVKAKLKGNPILAKLEWKTILENWDLGSKNHKNAFLQLEIDVEKHGWSSSRIREYKNLSRHLLEGNQAKRVSAIFPDEGKDTKLFNLVRIRPSCHLTKITSIESGKYASRLVKADRKNLDFVIECKKRNNSYREWQFPPLCELERDKIVSRSFKQHALIFCYAERLKQLTENNQYSARLEFKSWPSDDLNVFGRLRIWAARDERLVTAQEAAELFALLPSDLFWGEDHRIDLQYSLKARWNSLPNITIDVLEKRILRGCEPSVDEEIHRNIEESKDLAVRFGSWIVENNFKVSDGFKNDLDNLRKSEHPESETDQSVGVPDGKVRHKVGGRSSSVKRQSQLSSTLMSLRKKTKMNEYSSLDWYMTLSNLEAKEWTDRHIWYTFMILRDAPDYLFEDGGSIFAEWFTNVLAFYDGDNVFIRDEFFSRLTSLIMDGKIRNTYADIGQRFGERRWKLLNEFLYPGLLAKALFSYTEIRGLSDDSSAPGFWLDAAARLLALPGDNGCYALAYFMSEIEWLYRLAPSWTRSHIFTNSIDNDNLIAEAFWMGLVERGDKNFDIDFELYMEIKPHLIIRLSRPFLPESRITQGLSLLLLMGWLRRKDGERWVSDSDIRVVLKNSSDEFRQYILMELKKYASNCISKRNSNWVSDIEQFFMKVWPRTRSAKSNASIRGMLDVIFISPKFSATLSSIIVPIIGKVTRSNHVLKYLLDYHSDTLNNYPSAAIKFLHALLKDNYHDFPDEMKKFIAEIEKEYPKILKDIRLKEIIKIILR